MSNVQLTKDSDYLICAIFKSYMDQRKSGTPKSNAKMLGSSKTLHEELMPEWSFEDVDETCRELHRAGLLQCTYADNVAYYVSLNDAGIIYMENRFAGKFDTIVEYMAKVKSAIPFI